ncbi:hypothetical protein B9Z55_006527 [Caenorhabditis nigoni]|nr:hypothetical protein B9Z55_006527 [Caenorhabditis nigoni]
MTNLDDGCSDLRLQTSDFGNELDAAHFQEASDALLIAISFFRRLIDVIEVKKVLKGPKGRHCLGFMARCLSLNVPLLPNDRNQFLKETK